MRDQHHGALVFLQRHCQRLAHLQVQVVGGFVQQQQVGAQVRHQRQGQARLFAAGERRRSSQTRDRRESRSRPGNRAVPVRWRWPSDGARRCTCSRRRSPTSAVPADAAQSSPCAGPARHRASPPRSSSPASSFTRVDLPAPLRPSSAMRSPGYTVRLTLSTARGRHSRRPVLDAPAGGAAACAVPGS